MDAQTPTLVRPLVATEIISAADPMLAYYLSALQVRLERVRNTIQGNAFRQNIFDDLEKELLSFETRFTLSEYSANHAAWTEVYRMERMLALIVPGNELLSELKRQTAEAADEGMPSAPRLITALATFLPKVNADGSVTNQVKDTHEEELRSLLLDTLEDMHWTSQRKFYARPLLKQATYRIVWIGLGAFALFLLPYIIAYLKILYGGKPSLTAWSGFPLYTALTAGLFGSLFSRLLYIQQNKSILSLGAIRDAREITSILLRACVGTTGAVIVYFFLQSGVLQGGLFPHFDKINFAQLDYTADDATAQAASPMKLFYPNQSLALLVVWCFIAGFSERFVPSILQTTETTLGRANAPK